MGYLPLGFLSIHAPVKSLKGFGSLSAWQIETNQHWLADRAFLPHVLLRSWVSLEIAP
jgi:hypothetical protein